MLQPVSVYCMATQFSLWWKSRGDNWWARLNACHLRVHVWAKVVCIAVFEPNCVWVCQKFILPSFMNVIRLGRCCVFVFGAYYILYMYGKLPVYGGSVGAGFCCYCCVFCFSFYFIFWPPLLHTCSPCPGNRHQHLIHPLQLFLHELKTFVPSFSSTLCSFPLPPHLSPPPPFLLPLLLPPPISQTIGRHCSLPSTESIWILFVFIWAV